MAYNKAGAEKAWLQWKEAEEQKMRALGVDEETIQVLRAYDWEAFKADRRFRERQQMSSDYLDLQAAEPAELPVTNIESLLDSIENEDMLQVLLTVDKLTLQAAFARMLGYSSKEIASRMGLTDTAVDMRLWRLRNKLKKLL